MLQKIIKIGRKIRNYILGLFSNEIGIDLGTSQGTPVQSSLGGIVIGGGNTDEVRGCFSYGKWILVRHNNGLSTLYAHLSKVLVKKGKKIKRGDIIAKTGSSGLSTGPHLHYEVRHNGKALNPSRFFFDDMNYFATKSKSK